MNKIRKHIRMRLVSGILVLIPLVVTLLLLNMLIKAFSGLILPLLEPVRGDLPHYTVFALAVIGTLLLVYMIGLVTTHFVGQRLLRLGESLILRVPIAKTIYAASKQIVDVFAAGNRAAFKAVVLVQFPHPGAHVVGFYTGSIRDEAGQLNYNVFIPTTPNPTSGFLVLYPSDIVKFSNMTIEEGVKMIVSGGVITPYKYTLTPPPKE